MLLYAIKNNFRVDWGHTILCHMLPHNEHVDGLPYAHFLTKIFHHFNINVENELCFSMNKSSYCISIKRINRKMGVIFNQHTHEIKYLENDEVENQPEAHSGEKINPPFNHPPSEARTVQPSNQMIIDYLQGFWIDVMTEIGHLSSRMDLWELSQSGYQGGGSNDGNDLWLDLSRSFVVFFPCFSYFYGCSYFFMVLTFFVFYGVIFELTCAGWMFLFS